MLNASPYHMNKQQQRYEVLRERIADGGMAVVYCNLVGGQDELVFDGASFALNANGELAYQAEGLRSAAAWLDILDYAKWQDMFGRVPQRQLPLRLKFMPHSSSVCAITSARMDSRRPLSACRAVSTPL